jgi:hypothetical protein
MLLIFLSYLVSYMQFWRPWFLCGVGVLMGRGYYSNPRPIYTVYDILVYTMFRKSCICSLSDF